MGTDASIQTHLLRAELDNAWSEYRVGDREVIDGLCDYCPLHPWDGRSRLVVAVGDWHCEHCRLNGQWAKAVFAVEEIAGELMATLEELTVFQPSRAAELAGIHFIESDLAELSGLWDSSPLYEGFARWKTYPVRERCERVAAGFRAWCSAVAGVDIA